MCPYELIFISICSQPCLVFPSMDPGFLDSVMKIPLIFRPVVLNRYASESLSGIVKVQIAELYARGLSFGRSGVGAKNSHFQQVPRGCSSCCFGAML